jgi:hypothetical protein
MELAIKEVKEIGLQVTRAIAIPVELKELLFMQD